MTNDEPFQEGLKKLISYKDDIKPDYLLVPNMITQSKQQNTIKSGYLFLHNVKENDHKVPEISKYISMLKSYNKIITKRKQIRYILLNSYKIYSFCSDLRFILHDISLEYIINKIYNSMNEGYTDLLEIIITKLDLIKRYSLFFYEFCITQLFDKTIMALIFIFDDILTFIKSTKSLSKTNAIMVLEFEQLYTKLPLKNRLLLQSKIILHESKIIVHVVKHRLELQSEDQYNDSIIPLDYATIYKSLNIQVINNHIHILVNYFMTCGKEETTHYNYIRLFKFLYYRHMPDNIKSYISSCGTIVIYCTKSHGFGDIMIGGKTRLIIEKHYTRVYLITKNTRDIEIIKQLLGNKIKNRICTLNQFVALCNTNQSLAESPKVIIPVALS